MKSQSISLVFGLLMAGNVLSIVIAATAYQFATQPSVPPSTLASLQERISRLESKQTELLRQNDAAAGPESGGGTARSSSQIKMRNELVQAAEQHLKNALHDEIDGMRDRLQALRQQASELEAQAKQHEDNARRLLEERDRWRETSAARAREAKTQLEERALTRQKGNAKKDSGQPAP